jgi:hypothetical protein
MDFFPVELSEGLPKQEPVSPKDFDTCFFVFLRGKILPGLYWFTFGRITEWQNLGNEIINKFLSWPICLFPCPLIFLRLKITWWGRPDGPKADVVVRFIRT